MMSFGTMRPRRMSARVVTSHLAVSMEVQVMSTQENKAIVRRLVEEAQAGGNLHVIDELISPDFVDHSAWPGIPATREGVKQIFGMFHAALANLQVIIHDQVAEAERVVTRKTLRGIHQGNFLGIPPTGNVIAIEVIDILRLKNGQITDHWNLVDQHGLLQQLGLVPAPVET
jgi:predicted ester cyclase